MADLMAAHPDKTPIATALRTVFPYGQKIETVEKTVSCPIPA